jgi:hypothetical protein
MAEVLLRIRATVQIRRIKSNVRYRTLYQAIAAMGDSMAMWVVAWLLKVQSPTEARTFMLCSYAERSLGGPTMLTCI